MRPSKRAITGLLVVHLVLCWTAVVLRIDRFPLTWAPMYSVYVPKEGTEYKTTHKNRRFVLRKGWKATHRDGSTSWVSGRMLNVPRRGIWRLYYQRTYGKGPPRHKQANHDAGTVDRWLWGLEPGEDFVDRNWPRRLFESINKTFGHRPEDPQFIVELTAQSERLVFDLETDEFKGREPRNRTIRWKDKWAEDFR
jgi:hypothetical protein